MPDTSTLYIDSLQQLPYYDSLPKELQQQLQQVVYRPAKEEYEHPLGVILGVLSIIVISYIITELLYRRTPRYKRNNLPVANHHQKALVYYGKDLGLTEAVITRILQKHLPFFNGLTPEYRNKFLRRLREFMRSKIFVIHDKSGFREMPVLMSAAAVQLTFGLNNYLLPDFDYINIYPEEFLGTNPTIRFLEGNVSDNCINLSWKHFFKGFQLPEDGQNVGLHEMAHALYFQTFLLKKDVDGSFRDEFHCFDDCGNKVYNQEQLLTDGFYSRYAMRNFQEFWAESIELFFEKPAALKQKYPDLYTALTNLLNQDPAAGIPCLL